MGGGGIFGAKIVVGIFQWNPYLRVANLGMAQVDFKPRYHTNVDWEQSLYFLLSSLSRGKTSRTPVRGNLGKEKLGFRAPVFAMSFRGSTNSREKIGTSRSLIQMRTCRQYFNDSII